MNHAYSVAVEKMMDIELQLMEMYGRIVWSVTEDTMVITESGWMRGATR